MNSKQCPFLQGNGTNKADAFFPTFYVFEDHNLLLFQDLLLLAAWKIFNLVARIFTHLVWETVSALLYVTYFCCGFVGGWLCEKVHSSIHFLPVSYGTDLNFSRFYLGTLLPKFGVISKLRASMFLFRVWVQSSLPWLQRDSKSVECKGLTWFH